NSAPDALPAEQAPPVVDPGDATPTAPSEPIRIGPGAPPRQQPVAVQTTGDLAEPGEPLSPVLQEKIGRLIDLPLREVRIFRNRRAEGITRALAADAVTVGPNVFVAPGEGNPGLASGEALIAHELQHVAEQAAPLSAEPDPEREEQRALRLE